VGQGGEDVAGVEGGGGGGEVRVDRIGQGGGDWSASPGMRVSCTGRYSAGSRANRAAAATAGRGAGGLFSVAFSSMEAILVTLTTSRSRARWQAGWTGPGPWRRAQPGRR